jgi:hypothetical protein
MKARRADDCVMPLSAESDLLVPGPPFSQEQRAAVCALMPRGVDEKEVQGALRYCEHLAAAHKECVQGRQGVPSRSFTNLRDNWARYAKSMHDAAQIAEQIMPTASALEADEIRQQRQLHESAARRVAGYWTMAKANKHPRDSHRELVYMHVLHIWTGLGGKLSMSHDPYEGTTTGPVIPFFRLVASLIFDEPALSDSTIIEIVKRDREKRKGKPSQNRRK